MTPDARRTQWRQGLSSLYLPFYDALCAELSLNWAPYNGVRTIQEQDALYAQGRSVPGPNPTVEKPLGGIVTKAQGGKSAHNYGCAGDWTWFDENGNLEWLDKNDPRWNVYGQALGKVGLRWGKEFGDIDHNELMIACDWVHVLGIYQHLGMTGAQEHIQANLIHARPLTAL